MITTCAENPEWGAGGEAGRDGGREGRGEGNGRKRGGGGGVEEQRWGRGGRGGERERERGREKEKHTDGVGLILRRDILGREGGREGEKAAAAPFAAFADRPAGRYDYSRYPNLVIGSSCTASW